MLRPTREVVSDSHSSDFKKIEGAEGCHPHQSQDHHVFGPERRSLCQPRLLGQHSERSKENIANVAMYHISFETRNLPGVISLVRLIVEYLGTPAP